MFQRHEMLVPGTGMSALRPWRASTYHSIHIGYAGKVRGHARNGQAGSRQLAWCGPT